MTVAPTAGEIRRRIDEAPMSTVQIQAVALTILLSALDGYDVLSVTFAAPALSAAWGTGKAALGLLLSSGLVGMAIGSFFLAPLADTMGRKRIVLASLGLMAIGSLLCATASSLSPLIAWRVLTGLGIGACVAVLYPIAAEFSNARRRPLSLALTAMGYPIGGLIGSIAANTLLDGFGWRGLFIAGFAAAALLIPLAAWLLPESLGFLLYRNSRAGDRRLAALLARCGQPQVAPAVGTGPASVGYRAIFERDQRATTIRLTIVNALNVTVVYFVLSWMPQMVKDAGFSPAQSSRVAAAANMVGLVGGVLLGVVARRLGLARTTGAVILGLGVSTITFGLTPPSLGWLMAAAGLSGLFLFASTAGIYATLAVSYRDEARASSAGFVIGVGRIASAAAPALAGGLFAHGFGRAEISCVFGLFALVAGAAFLWRRRSPGAGTGNGVSA